MSARTPRRRQASRCRKPRAPSAEASEEAWEEGAAERRPYHPRGPPTLYCDGAAVIRRIPEVRGRFNGLRRGDHCIVPLNLARGRASAPRVCDGPLYPRAQAFRHARQHVHVNVPARRAASGLRATELHEPGMTKGSARAQPAGACTRRLCARAPRRLTH